MVGINQGAFLGGVAEGQIAGRTARQADRRLDIQGRQAGVQERQVGVNEQQQRVAQIEAMGTSAVAGLKELRQSLKAKGGANPDQIARAIAPVESFISQLRKTEQLAAESDPKTAKLSGQKADLMQAQVDAIKGEAIPSLDEAAVGKGRQAGLGKIAEAGTVASAVPANKQGETFASLLGVPTESRPEFLKLLDAFGKTKEGSRDFNLIEARLNKLTAESGFGFVTTFGPNGDIESIRVGPGAGTASALPSVTGSQIDETRAQLDASKTALQITDATLAAIDQDPSIVGLVGTARRLKEGAAGILSDLAKTSLNVAGLDAKKVFAAFDGLVEFEQEQGTDKSVSESFKPKSVAAFDVWRGVLKYHVARTLQPTGKLLKDAVETAEGLTDFTGLTSSKQVSDRLNQIRLLLKARTASLQRRGEQAVGGTATTPPVSAAPSGAPVQQWEVINGELVPVQ